ASLPDSTSQPELSPRPQPLARPEPLVVTPSQPVADSASSERVIRPRLDSDRPTRRASGMAAARKKVTIAASESARNLVEAGRPLVHDTAALGAAAVASPAGADLQLLRPAVVAAALVASLLGLCVVRRRKRLDTLPIMARGEQLLHHDSD